jgi:uncharacterized protein YndB with AHSA1/START domain
MDKLDSLLVVRRSIHVRAIPERVWQEFTSFERMEAWWGVLIGEPEAGTAKGQRLITYEPHLGGHVEMQVDYAGAPANFGGKIITFDRARELTFENDWIPNRGWIAPSLITIRLTPALGGTVVEVMHHAFERTGEGASDDLAGYESGWGMTQLNALRTIVESV